MLVVRASGSIDRDDLDAAVRQAALAVNKSGALDRGERIRIYGQALGTHGRALMHAGRNVDAEPILREATVHHRAHARTMPTELARSLSYLATCVRRVGRFADALETVEEAIRINTPDALQWAAARVNETYLRLERGRILLAMGNHDEAERALLDVAPHDPITTYPRLGAERSLLTLRLATGHHESAHQAFRRCLEAGRSLLARGETSTHAKVAAVGAAEGMNCLSVTVSERANAEALWTKAFGTQPTDDEIRKVLAMWIF
jgi:tetratricopeptide (TPR) repeat protein